MKSLWSSSDSRWKSKDKRFTPNLFWTIVVLGVCAFIFAGRFWANRNHHVFLTTISPEHTYSVVLRGDKGRPLIIPNQVRADVFKSGQPFISDIWLHSTGDSFDLSFEAGFPDVRWLDDNVLEFYRAQYYERGADLLQVENTETKTIKYLRVQAENKLLIFELRPASSVSVEIPAPRSDSQWIAVEGGFTDGSAIPFTSKSFDRRSRQQQHFTYQISVDASGATIASKS